MKNYKKIVCELLTHTKNNNKVEYDESEYTPFYFLGKRDGLKRTYRIFLIKNNLKTQKIIEEFYLNSFYEIEEIEEFCETSLCPIVSCAPTSLIFSKISEIEEFLKNI